VATENPNFTSFENSLKIHEHRYNDNVFAVVMRKTRFINKRKRFPGLVALALFSK